MTNNSFQESCIFCQIAAGSVESWVVAENDLALAFFDTDPVNAYHTLVIPKNHHQDIFDAPEEVVIGAMQLVKQVVARLEDKVSIENIQILSSSGTAAQQEVPHLHFHVIPRFNGDRRNISIPTRPELKQTFDELLARLS